MKLFEEPKMEVVKFDVEDIVTTSTTGGDGNNFFDNPCIG